jgi:hypothetical protein
MIAKQRTLTFEVPCGRGKHEVTITLTEQGAVEIFSPCQLLPEPARKLTGSNCLDHLPKRLINALINALRDKEVREAAVEVLRYIGEPAVNSLIEALRNKQVREAAVEALVSIGEPAIKPLIKALLDWDEQVRGKAVEALVQIGEPAVDPLIEALRDWQVREGAVEALV